MSIDISAVIITFNESGNIERCIRSVQDITKEVIVVDSGSTDDTVLLARQMGAHVVEYSWNGYGANKNLGIALARSKWVLSIDADEWLPEKTRDCIESLKLKANCVYCLELQNIYKGRVLIYGAYGIELKPRLFEKDKVRWEECHVHETLTGLSDLKKVKTGCVMFHHLADTKDELLGRESKYAKLAAKDLLSQRTRMHFLKEHLGGTYHFMRSYLLQMGILEGKLGWETSMVQVHKNRAKVQAYKALRSGGNPN